MKKVMLFCGVESTGKTTTIKKIYSYLKNKGLNVKIVHEVGREVCASSGGVFEMNLLSYEQILYMHQSNFLKAYADNRNDIILMDTDATYTRYYLEKDERLKNCPFAENLIELSEKIVNNNIISNKITQVIYLNSNCPFVQDGTRTYEKTRKQDDETLLKLYKKNYKKISVVTENCWENRIDHIKKIINASIY